MWKKPLGIFVGGVGAGALSTLWLQHRTRSTHPSPLAATSTAQSDTVQEPGFAQPGCYLQHDDSTSISTKAVELGASITQSFQPIKQIHQHLAGVHIYDGCPNRQLIAHHYCTHVNDEMHQCVIYESNKANARLIGIEYVITERLFKQLPEEEKRFWHSHKYEVESGLLAAPGVPKIVEHGVMKNLATTYGKTWHTWQVDRGDSVPLGEPQLMMALMKDGQLSPSVQVLLEEQTNIAVAKNREERKDIRAPTPSKDADQWYHKQNK
tara:strand:- start:92 stop:889 length:798 start_codon:yes stop_codon:yes gene_type:complete